MIFVTYYTTLPSQYLTNMACTIASFYNMVPVDMNGYTSYQIDPVAYCIGLSAVTVALIPMCLIQDLQKFKFLGYIVLGLDTCILLTSIVLIFEPKEGKINVKDDSTSTNNISIALICVGQFCSVFQTQVYFLQIM